MHNLYSIILEIIFLSQQNCLYLTIIKNTYTMINQSKAIVNTLTVLEDALMNCHKSINVYEAAKEVGLYVNDAKLTERYEKQKIRLAN